MLLLLKVSRAQLEAIAGQLDETMRKAIRAGILGFIFQRAGTPLLWEEKDTDETHPYFVETVTGDRTIKCVINQSAKKQLEEISVEYRIHPLEIVQKGIAAYFAGLERSKTCLLRKKQKGYPTKWTETVPVETDIFPLTKGT